MLDQWVIAIEFDIRALDVEIHSFVEIVGDTDFVTALASHPLPSRRDMSVERPFSANIFAALDTEIELAHLCESEFGASRELLAGMLEPGVTIG
ncbi:hypothetical protein C478_12295 [Natrinema thermotolerans DSM 11552]|nr:hypothetical protein C478_12295 [Natrinema thermotolerans DSM 11552]